MEIYLDLAILLNFLVDFLLLLGTNRLSGFPLGPGRCALGAALGALYSGGCCLPGFRFLGGTFWPLVCLGLMGALAFGWGRGSAKRMGVFLLLSLGLGGLAIQLGQGDFWGLVTAAGLLWLLCRLAFGEQIGGREYVPLELRFGERRIQLTALRDSGNTLRDPVTGEPVVVIGSQEAAQLTGLTQAQLSRPLETLAARPIPGLRLIPYRAVGQAAGMLLALRLEVKEAGEVRQRLVAFAPEGLGSQGAFQALCHG